MVRPIPLPLPLPLLLLISISFLAAGCRSAVEPPDVAPEEVPKNIILFIGDGMGASHFTLLSRIRGEESSLPRFTSTAMVTTQSASSAVTDSGAAATAMASGVKTTNAALSVTPDGDEVETVLEIAERHGMATGLVTTTRFWDATPAAFAAHTLDRKDAPTIIDQMLSHDVDLIISNGAEQLPEDELTSLMAIAAERGYATFRTPQALEPRDGNVLAVFEGPPMELDNPEAPLPVLTRYALDHLSNDPDGFFLMIESEATDGSSHKNQTKEVLQSLQSLDRSVNLGLDFARSHPDTLVLFVGDHETGALQIAETKEGDLELEWYSGHHTGQALPIFAYGPGAARFTGWIDNTDIGKWLKDAVDRR